MNTVHDPVRQRCLLSPTGLRYGARRGARGVSDRRRGPGSPGRLNALSVFLCESVFYGAFIWARRVLKCPKRRFLARAGPDRVEARHVVDELAGRTKRRVFSTTQPQHSLLKISRSDQHGWSWGWGLGLGLGAGPGAGTTRL